MDRRVEPQNDIASRFGRRIKSLREVQKITQAELGRRLGIDRSFLSALENGKKSPTLGMMEIIALGFQMSLSDLCRPLEHQVARATPEERPSALASFNEDRDFSPYSKQPPASGPKLSAEALRYLGTTSRSV